MSPAPVVTCSPSSPRRAPSHSPLHRLLIAPVADNSGAEGNTGMTPLSSHPPPISCYTQLWLWHSSRVLSDPALERCCNPLPGQACVTQGQLRSLLHSADARAPQAKRALVSCVHARHTHTSSGHRRGPDRSQVCSDQTEHFLFHIRICQPPHWSNTGGSCFSLAKELLFFFR